MPYTYKNKTKSLTAWAEELGYTDGGSLLYYRINHWGVEKALAAKPSVPNRLTFKGETKSIPEWSKTLGVPAYTIHKRLKRFGSVYGALSAPKVKAERHGMSKTPEYKIWDAIKSRCFNPNHPQTADYMQRGITMYKPWKLSFTQFITDVGRRPKTPKNLTIERIDNDKGYFPGNVKWATRKEQQRNTRSNHMHTEVYNGVEQTHCVAEWSEILDVNKTLLYHRIKANGSLFLSK
jgi:hypothetical protein